MVHKKSKSLIFSSLNQIQHQLQEPCRSQLIQRLPPVLVGPVALRKISRIGSIHSGMRGSLVCNGYIG